MDGCKEGISVDLRDGIAMDSVVGKEEVLFFLFVIPIGDVWLEKVANKIGNSEGVDCWLIETEAIGVGRDDGINFCVGSCEGIYDGDLVVG